MSYKEMFREKKVILQVPNANIVRYVENYKSWAKKR